MSFEFLTPAAADAVARSPMERQAAKAGARFEVRDGWNVAVAYAGEAARRSPTPRTAPSTRCRATCPRWSSGAPPSTVRQPGCR
jgi:hypothetical protein